MLIFRDTSAIFKAMSPEERQRILEQWNTWFDRLTAEGKLQQGHPLKREGRVVSQSGGRVIDGPFVESKEAIGGFFLLTVGSLEEATEIAKECPSLRIGITVEVRPVAGNRPELQDDWRKQAELVSS
ncbi:MAG: YciI family protein [Terrimicrobiaceae bacterium]